MLKLMPDDASALIERGANNSPWIRQAREDAVNQAAPWLAMSPRQLWELIFSPELPRAWHVWSDGHCPSCQAAVPMYQWKTDPFKNPWKMACPHCEALFPTNDFQAYHRSGLDKQGLFDAARADRGLLFNAAHPDPGDPLHKFGVDDGHGYVEQHDSGKHVWRFIAAYLIYGQWKKLIVNGVSHLAQAYLVTGDKRYSLRALVLLDRIADVYPAYDFRKQGIMYDEPCGTRYDDAGYVSTWHDACFEAQQMTQAYAMVRSAADDPQLVAFIREQAQRHELAFPKDSHERIIDHIDTRFIHDMLHHPDKVKCNYPSTEILKATMHLVLDTPAHAEKAQVLIDAMLETSTRVDGVTGEKGLTAYSSYVIAGLASFLAELETASPGYLRQAIQRVPALADTWRFHIDAQCLDRFYPQIGDCGYFGCEQREYVGAPFQRSPHLGASLFSFFWKLYEITGDHRFVQVLVRENDGTTSELPRDVYARDPRKFQHDVAEVMAAHGPRIQQASVNKKQWGLAILRRGRGEHRRAAWLHHQRGASHCHADMMNLGLFAFDTDFMPEFGYPPVNRGGWVNDYATWYRTAGAHCTVVVDEVQLDFKSRDPATGVTRCFRDDPRVSTMSIDGLSLMQTEQRPPMTCYERSVSLVDIDDERFYLVDVFRVRGGSRHQWFMHSHQSTISTQGLSLSPGRTFEPPLMMRNVRTDASPAPGWTATWMLDDAVAARPSTGMQCIGLTHGAAVSCAQGWVQLGSFQVMEATWIPRLLVERHGSADLSSVFISVITPFVGRASISRVIRHGDSNAVEDDVRLTVEIIDGPVHELLLTREDVHLT